MYRSKFRMFKNINIFTSEERKLIKKFIEFDEKCFHQIDLDDKKIYWSNAWDLKINYLQNVNNLFELIYNLYNVFITHDDIFIKKKSKKFHQFIDFFFIWDVIDDFYGTAYEEYFSSFHQDLRYKFDDEPKRFLDFMKKINKIIKKDFSENIEDFKKIKYKIKKI